MVAQHASTECSAYGTILNDFGQCGSEMFVKRRRWLRLLLSPKRNAVEPELGQISCRMVQGAGEPVVGFVVAGVVSLKSLPQVGREFVRRFERVLGDLRGHLLVGLDQKGGDGLDLSIAEFGRVKLALDEQAPAVIQIASRPSFEQGRPQVRLPVLPADQRVR